MTVTIQIPPPIPNQSTVTLTGTDSTTLDPITIENVLTNPVTVLGSTKSDGLGNWSATFTIPAGVGTYDLEAVGTGGGASNNVWVLANGASRSFDAAPTSQATVVFVGSGNGSFDQAAFGANNVGSLDYVSGSNGTIVLNASGNQVSVLGGGDFIYFLSSNDVANLSTTGTNWDSVNGSNGAINLINAKTSVDGGNDIINFASGAGNEASLYGTGGVNWDSVAGSNGVVNLYNAQATVTGGNNYISFQGGSGADNVVALYGTSNNWDWVDGSNGYVLLNNAQTSIQGGGNFITDYGSNYNSVSLYNTADTWDWGDLSNDTIFLNSAQTSVQGGGDNVDFASGTNNVVSLYNTGAWDTVSGSNGGVLLTNAQSSVVGGGNWIGFEPGSPTGQADAVSLYSTGSNADWVDGSNAKGTVILNNAQTGLIGDNNTVDFHLSNTANVSGNNETFAFQPLNGSDIIRGWNTTDTMQFSGSDFANLSALFAHTAQVGSDTVVTLNSSDTVTLKGVSLNTFVQGHFTFV